MGKLCKCGQFLGAVAILLASCGALPALGDGSAENLIKNGDFETGLENWTAVQGHKEHFSLTMDSAVFFSGSNSLRIESLPPHSEDKYVWIGQSLSLQRGKTYKLSFYVHAGTKTTKKQYIHFHWPGQKTYSPYEIRASGPADWHNWHKQEFYFAAPANTATINLPFAGSGIMWIDNIVLTESARPDTSKDIMRQDSLFTYQPRGTEELPLTELLAEEKTTGYITYFRENPRDTYPWSVPERSEITHALKVSATPGECTSSWFSVYAINKLSRVKVSIQNNLNKAGGFPKESLELRTVRCWEQRTGWRSTTYYIIPELLEKNWPADIPDGQTQTFWLTIRIPEDMPPGNYPVKISIEPGDGGSPSVLNMDVTVLPFILKEPEDIHWTMWWASWGYDRMSVQDIERELIDIKAHGIKSILVGNPIFSDSEFQKAENGMRYFSSKLLEIQKIRRKLRMNGPLILYWGDSLEPLALKSFGKDMSELNSAESRAILIDALQAIDRFIKKTGGEEYGQWYFLGMDEPGAHPARRKRALLQYALAKEAGINTTTTINRGAFADSLKPLASSMCWAGTPADDATNQYYYNAGPEYWFYGSGVYTGQEGGLVPNRHICGFLFYKMRAALNMSFLYARTGCTGDPYDDFDGNDFSEPKDAFIAYPSPDGPVPTLQWEGIREGINDYRYIHTLEQLLKREEEKEEKNRVNAFKDVKMRWENLMDSILWDTNPDIVDNKRLSGLRDKVTGLILELTRTTKNQREN